MTIKIYLKNKCNICLNGILLKKLNINFSTPIILLLSFMNIVLNFLLQENESGSNINRTV